MFARFGGFDDHGMMQVAGGGHIDDVDVLAVNHFLPIGAPFFPAHLFGGGFCAGFVAAADDFQHGLFLQVEEFVDLAKRVAVGLPHELRSD